MKIIWFTFFSLFPILVRSQSAASAIKSHVSTGTQTFLIKFFKYQTTSMPPIISLVSISQRDSVTFDCVIYVVEQNGKVSE